MSYEGRLTRERLEAAAERIRQNYGNPVEEFHHPRCPKIVSAGKKACRCGACPLESILEDDLERMERDGK